MVLLATTSNFLHQDGGRPAAQAHPPRRSCFGDARCAGGEGATIFLGAPSSAQPAWPTPRVTCRRHTPRRPPPLLLQTASGIFLPEVGKKLNEGEVVAVGPGATTRDGKILPMNVKVRVDPWWRARTSSRARGRRIGLGRGRILEVQLSTSPRAYPSTHTAMPSSPSFAGWRQGAAAGVRRAPGQGRRGRVSPLPGGGHSRQVQVRAFSLVVVDFFILGGRGSCHNETRAGDGWSADARG